MMSNAEKLNNIEKWAKDKAFDAEESRSFHEHLCSIVYQKASDENTAYMDELTLKAENAQEQLEIYKEVLELLGYAGLPYRWDFLEEATQKGHNRAFKAAVEKRILKYW